MNDVKSVPFAHMPAVKKSMYTPQVTKEPTIPTNNVKFANHFSNLHHGKWNSQNLQ